MATKSPRAKGRLSNKREFELSVFVNCPFDPAYRALFRPLIFTIHSLGFIPRFALERSDSGESRLHKIEGLIGASKWALHDLSRCVATRVGEHYRMNMPLELGMDYGARKFGNAQLQEKRCLILEKKRYRFQQAISDLAGCDIKAHNDEPRAVIRIVQDWLVQEAGATPQSPTMIWKRFNVFIGDTYEALKAKRYSKKDIEKLPENDLSKRMLKWILDNPIST